MSRSVFVLLVALVLGGSSAFPGRDLPDTPYDESELLPYESTPLFSMEMLEQPSGTGQVAVKLDFLAFPPSFPISSIEIARSAEPADPSSDILRIRHRSLRC